MSKPELGAVPQLAAGVRFNDRGQQPRMLLIGGRELRLSGPSLEIVTMCDGTHTVEQIAARLHELYAKAEPERVTQDLLRYLELLHGQKAIEY
jgi:Coenzyme PQQ synthesis protein D (PqqD)